MFERRNRRIAEKRRAGILESSFPTGDPDNSNTLIRKYFYVDYVKKANGKISKDYFEIRPWLNYNPNLKHGYFIEIYAVDQKILTDYTNEFKPRSSVDVLDFKEVYPFRYEMKKTLRIIKVWDDLLDSRENQLFLENGISIETNTYRTTKDLSRFRNITPKNAELILQILRDLYKDPQTVKYIDKYEGYLVEKFAHSIGKSPLTAASPVIDADTFSSHLITMREEEHLMEETVELKIIPKIMGAYSELQEQNTQG